MADVIYKSKYDGSNIEAVIEKVQKRIRDRRERNIGPNFENPDVRVLSLGAGVQSSTIMRMSHHGEFEHTVDAAIFADTQNEPEWVYRQLDLLDKELGDEIPIVRETMGNLADDWFEGQESTINDERAMGAALPVHLAMPDGSKGMANRTCTPRYKLQAILKATRQLIGLSRGQQAVDRFAAEAWIGISMDEAHRANPSTERWVNNRFPLLYDTPMRRVDCIAWMKSHGYAIPKRSACVQCPYRSNAEWRDIRSNPDAWKRAVAFDKRLRSEKRYVSSRGDEEKAQLRGTPYLHASLIPLEEADIDDADSDQLDMFGNDCGGLCGA